MTNDSNQTVSGAFSRAENFSNSGFGARGAGLASLGDALADAGLISAAPPRRLALGIEAMPLQAALASVERPAGPLLLECQGQRDLALAKACCAKLVRRMAADGREVGDDMQRDAIAFGAHALTMWRETGTGTDGAAESNAARVAWRAVVTELSRDHFGESIQIHTVSDDWLWHNAAQGDESRQERAARFKVSRAASTRQARLVRRLASMPGGRGKRAAAIERVGNAAAMLLAGETLDSAAAMAGFTGNGRTKPGDRFKQSCKRLGLQVGQFDARTSARLPVIRPASEEHGRAGLGALPVDAHGVEVIVPPVVMVPAVLPFDVDKLERRRKRRVWIQEQRFALFMAGQV